MRNLGKKYPFIMISALIICLCMSGMKVSAKKTENVEGTFYEFDKKGSYDFANSEAQKVNVHYGVFTLEGSFSEISRQRDFQAYEINEGNVDLKFAFRPELLSAGSEEWHLCDDKSKKVNGEVLDSNILKGAVVLKTSLDGVNWFTETVYTDIEGSQSFDEIFYTTKNIQQINGCYYQVIVCYELERQIEDSKVFMLSFDKFEYKKYAEIYEFYLEDASERQTSATKPDAIPRKELGQKANTGKGNGYSGNIPITNKDPHYGWEVGTFYVNGFTRETVDEKTNRPVFLKNLGDRVTLWFQLEQNINCLNGKSNLSISEDTDGYDQYFETNKTNFGRGALLIRYTDNENVKHPIVIYKDYLAASACTGANTKVELFEEGDYEVALDYEIRDAKGIASYTNYRIYFTFSIRNGNCMVYPFDVVSGSELSDNTVTENGFRLDMAKSRYLDVDVTRTVLVNNGSGREEDVRFNRPAKDGEQYKDEGIYRFDVKNRYTGENTTKTIYVGTDKFLKALAVGKLSIHELEQKMEEGYEIDEGGRLIAPPEPESIEEKPLAEPKEEESADDSSEQEGIDTEKGKETVVPEEDLQTAALVKEQKPKEPPRWQLFVAILAIILLLMGGLGIWILKKGDNEDRIDKKINDTMADDGGIADKDTKNNGAADPMVKDIRIEEARAKGEKE